MFNTIIISSVLVSMHKKKHDKTSKDTRFGRGNWLSYTNTVIRYMYIFRVSGQERDFGIGNFSLSRKLKNFSY